MEATKSPRGVERRRAAPHPGPGIAKHFLEPIGLDAAAFAGLIGMDAGRLAAMLEGTLPIDVDAAVRFGRSLGLPPERLVGAQLRHDFARSRERESGMPRPPSDTLAAQPLPPGARSGSLARVAGVEADQLLFFETQSETEAPGMERVHKLEHGDRLRVYAADGSCVWAGPLLTNLDGTPLFVFAGRDDWQAWFDEALRAEWIPARSA